MTRQTTNRATKLVGVTGLALGVAASLSGASKGEPLTIAMATAPAPSHVLAEPRLAFVDESTLAGKLDLDAKRLADDHFEVTLPDGSVATLSLDAELQNQAEDVLAKARPLAGAIVVMDLSGRVLALAERVTPEAHIDVTHAATEAWAPSASVFKLVTAAALVDAGVDPAASVCYHGGLRSIEAEMLTDNPRRDRSCGNLGSGVARSQNVILGKLALRHLDPEQLEAAAEKLGYGRAPAFALAAGSSTADVPSDPLELARAAAGFWHSSLSPLGGAVLAATIASGGLELQPRIVDRLINADGTPVKLAGPVVRRALAAETAATVGRLMVGTTRVGTAKGAFKSLDVAVAGKTGSLSRKGANRLDYSWFVGFAPADHPQVVVSVLLGNSPDFRMRAPLAARKVLEVALKN